MATKKRITRKKKLPTERFLIGKYQLGYRMVNLYADPNSTGGWFNTCRNEAEPQMHIGMNYEKIDLVMAVVFHEALEMSAQDQGLVYQPADVFMPGASDVVHFHFNHNQFTELAARAAYFIGNSYPDITAAWKKCRGI